MNKTIKTYLAGPIGVVMQIDAMTWRTKATENLRAVGIETLNPMGQNGGDRLGNGRVKLKEAVDNGNIKFIRKYVSKTVIPPDLKMVENANFLTVYIPEDNGYEICGTYGEITLAFYLGKPVYIITDRQTNKLPCWLVGCSTEIFISWNDYYSYIIDEWVI
jgi:nucleoside 2-deoxyribosyltransferase